MGSGAKIWGVLVAVVGAGLMFNTFTISGADTVFKQIYGMMSFGFGLLAFALGCAVVALGGVMRLLSELHTTVKADRPATAERAPQQERWRA